LKVLVFARQSNPYPDITFQHEDTTNLSPFADLSFDFCTRAVIIDWASPLPKNVFGIAAHIVEATFGHDHNRNFNAFLAAGDIGSVLKESALPITIEHRCVLSRNDREAVLISTARHS
jgi:hypothetical protein